MTDAVETTDDVPPAPHDDSSRPASQPDVLASDLVGRIRDRTARVVIVGQGYVGLPVAMGAVEMGFDVVGMPRLESTGGWGLLFPRERRWASGW
jgi:hypothetical protein